MRCFNENHIIKTTGGKTLNFEMLKNQNFVLFFYDKNTMSNCTLQLLRFAELYDEFRFHGFHVYGISADSIESHDRFKVKNNIPFTLISDEQKVLHDCFDVVNAKKIYGKTIKSTVRSTFVFKEGFVLMREFRNVKSIGHAKDVLIFIQDHAL